VTLGPRAVSQRVSDVALFYRITQEQAAQIVQNLTPCGEWGKEKLYSRWDVEEALESEGLKQGRRKSEQR
jgi:hypothetical protein